MNRIKFFAVLFSVSAIALTACDKPLPMEDFVNAKAAISRALSVRADTYASEEMTDATARLYEAHGLIQNNKIDDAKASAKEAEALAMAAYHKACPIAAKETIGIAQKSLDEAAEANADELAPAEYSEAKTALETAGADYENRSYPSAYTKALEADRSAKEAKAAALDKKDMLKDAIDEVKITLEKAEEYNAKEYAPENVKLAEENIALAETAYSNLELKKGFSAVEVAKINADEAYAVSIKEIAALELSKTESLLVRAFESKSAASDELTAANEAYQNAEAMFAEGRYREAIEYSREAALLSNLVAAQKDGDDDSVGEEVDTEKDYILYTVVYGDCLWKIADRHYKNPRKWKRIYNANKDKIRNPNLIYPGWVLKVPKE